jgi:hypothetical protein
LPQPFSKPDVHRISNFDPVCSENDSAVVNLKNRSWIRLVINVTANASEAALEKVKTDLHRFCPVSKVIRNSGTQIEKFGTSRGFERMQMDLSWKCPGNAVNNRRCEEDRAATRAHEL